MTEEENSPIINIDILSIKDFEKSKSAGKTIYKKEEYGKALDYARKKLSEFYENHGINLTLDFRHENLIFEWSSVNINGQDKLRKCWDFVDELNGNLKEVVKK